MATFTGRLFRMLMVDRSAKSKDIGMLYGQLESSKQVVLDILRSAANTPPNREQLAHVIGIERWGQARLRVALGQPFEMDEYDAYRPVVNGSLDALRSEFIETRDVTLGIAKQLLEKPSVVSKIIEHNDMGQMTVRSWLQYLDMHGTYELRNVK